ncbi:MAG TPA: ABC transporter permease [Cyclobacteriaceae bacterium]|nr:ABC transporter permease [Cyclobacteriaceae bacterium]
MLHTFLKSGWRNLISNKVYSVINISGLSLGLTCSLLIALWVIDEYGIDSFHEKGDRIYIVTSREIVNGEINYGGYDTPGLLGEELAKVLPEIEYSCGYGWTSFNTFAVGNKLMKLPGNFAGQDFLKIFSYPLLYGSRETALESPESIIISRRMATTLFGGPEQAMDKSVLFDNYKDLKVTGVFEDLGDNVSDKFEFMLNYHFFKEREKGWITDWGNSGPTTYVLLKEHVNAEEVRSKMQHFIKKYNKEYSENERLELGLQLFSEKYLYSNFKNGEVSGGRIEYVQLFEVVAVFILLIACINFMNMSTARSVTRAKEIGVRKVIGAMKSLLVKQFMTEALMSTVIAIVISITLMSLLLPEFNLLTGKNISSPLGDSRFWTGIGILTALTAVLSGVYPALFLSAFKPLAAIRNTFKLNSSTVIFRKGLVVFQFALSIIFVLGMIVISKQVDYIQNKNLGYQKNNLLYLKITGTMGTNFEGFKNELMQIHGVTGVSQMAHRPIEFDNSTSSVLWEGKAPDAKPSFTPLAVGYDFIKTMNSKLVLGRDFSEEHADSANFLINEAALKIIGYKDPIGMPLKLWETKGTIVGVVEDFHYNSLHVPIAPLVIRLQKRTWGYALIRTEPGKTSQVLLDMEALHKKFNPDFPFAHQFADEEYAASYKSEQVAQQLSQYFALLSIFISCLGLLGLVIFAAAQRTKEVGIRKVLGANTAQIVALLSGDFMKLVVLSILFSFPIAYYVMNEWLGNFEYRIAFEWWMFAVAGTGAVLIAMFTISFQAVKAAMRNPVDSLKAE